MLNNRYVFSQLMDFLPRHEFDRCVARYQGNRRIRNFSCFDQFLCMAFAQLTYRESLRDIEVCLAAQHGKLYHSGFRSAVKRSTLAEANEQRDGRNRDVGCGSCVARWIRNYRNQRPYRFP